MNQHREVHVAQKGHVPPAVAEAQTRGPRARRAQRTHQNALARAYLDRVLTDDPNSARALMLRGTIAMEDGDRAAARQFLDQSLHGNGEIDRAAVQRMITELDTPPRTRRR